MILLGLVRRKTLFSPCATFNSPSVTQHFDGGTVVSRGGFEEGIEDTLNMRGLQGQESIQHEQALLHTPGVVGIRTICMHIDPAR